MDLKRAYGVDKKAAEGGKWFDLTEDGRVKVARHNNPLFKAEIARLQKPHMHRLRSKRADNLELIDDITLKAMAKTILVDWEGISIDGEEIPYSKEKAYELMKEYEDFQEAISIFAVDRDNFTPEDQEELVGK